MSVSLLEYGNSQPRLSLEEEISLGILKGI